MNKMIFRWFSSTFLLTTILLSSCVEDDGTEDLVATCEVGDLPTIAETGISFPTTPAFSIPVDVTWQPPTAAFEIVNNETNIAYFAIPGQIPQEVWDTLSLPDPWSKNIDRFILQESSLFTRSPSAPSDCQDAACFTIIQLLNYPWLEIANTLSGDYIPCSSNVAIEVEAEPEPGHLVIKTIEKCQGLRFENEMYQLTDNQGNYYVMHATTTDEPTTDVTLPDGWSLSVVALDEALVITPVGDDEDCYYNIVLDHLGQGYHQYIYAESNYPDAL